MHLEGCRPRERWSARRRRRAAVTLFVDDRNEAALPPRLASFVAAVQILDTRDSFALFELESF